MDYCVEWRNKNNEKERKRKFIEKYVFNRTLTAENLDGYGVVNEAEKAWNRLEEIMKSFNI